MALAPAKLGAGKLIFGETGSATEFSKMVTAVSLEPEFDKGDTTHLLSGDSFVEESEAWKLKFTIAQSYGEDSLLLWLYEHSGETVPFEFVPSAKGKVQAKGEVKIRAGKIGGDVHKENTSELELSCIKKPIITKDYVGA